MSDYLMALDQGTTSTRAMIIDTQANVIASAQQQVTRTYPRPGWVEQDPELIWQSVLSVGQQALRHADISTQQIKAIGIANQRETTIVWSKETGKPIYPAIVWQDRRTADDCEHFIERGLEEMVNLKTGLLIDPYFSATKIRWILDYIPSAREQAERGALLFGTLDTYLLWKLTQGECHYTDATNASRTLLFNIHTFSWDEELIRYFDIPPLMLPVVRDSAADYGVAAEEFFGRKIPITALIGDQQASLLGHACFKKGMTKATFGTGCFLMMNTGDKPIKSKNRLLSTIAYSLPNNRCYALEGSVFVAGAAVQWMRDTMKMVQSANETESIAQSVADTHGVYMVPAFSGLGAPFWDPMARGAILGLTIDSGVAHVVRAALESVCYQVKDLVYAMEKDGAVLSSSLHVDGGMVVNDWLMQFLADILPAVVLRAKNSETTALGAALLSGFSVGIYQDVNEIESLWQMDKTFEPMMTSTIRNSKYQGWLTAVSRIRSENRKQ